MAAMATMDTKWLRNQWDRATTTITTWGWFHTCYACARGLERFQNAAVGETNVGSLYGEMRPNRCRGSHATEIESAGAPWGPR
jgi:hypothetical protein